VPVVFFEKLVELLLYPLEGKVYRVIGGLGHDALITVKQIVTGIPITAAAT
jgi:hypothetical protein